MTNILLIPNINILNANALSSPYTIGFPAMTAWLGATHALERRLKTAGFDDLRFKSMAVVCHKIDLQTYKGDGDYVHSIIGTGNPLNKTGQRSSFIEEARCHLTVSLVMVYDRLSLGCDDELTESVDQLLQATMKLAGGDVIQSAPSTRVHVFDDDSRVKFLRRLMPGHCLIERRDLMTKSMEGENDAIDALLDYLKVTHRSESDNHKKVAWKSDRKEKGWIVPIATGFQGVTDVGQAEYQRDPDTPHRFAESVVTLGEFVMPYRITDLDHMLWHYHVDLEKNLYLCQQNKFMSEI